MAESEWAGEKGRFWAEHADWFSDMLAEFGHAVIRGAAFQAGERVLDVGAGCGDVTLAAAEAVGPDGSVLAADLSTDELGVTAARAADRSLTNVEVRVADASVDDLGPALADVLVSRFGVMFFEDPVAAFTHLHGALRPGGRVAFACWQAVEQNDWILRPQEAVDAVLPIPPPPPGSPGPFSLAEADHVRGVLGRAGFTDISFDDVREPVHLGASVEEAIEFVSTMEWAKATFARAPQDRVDEALARARAVLDEHAGPAGEIDLPGAAWVVHARA